MKKYFSIISLVILLIFPITSFVYAEEKEDFTLIKYFEFENYKNWNVIEESDELIEVYTLDRITSHRQFDKIVEYRIFHKIIYDKLGRRLTIHRRVPVYKTFVKNVIQRTTFEKHFIKKVIQNENGETMRLCYYTDIPIKTMYFTEYYMK